MENRAVSSEWTDHSVMSHVESAKTPTENNIRNYEMDESSDSEDERHLEGNILTNAGMEVSSIYSILYPFNLLRTLY